MSLRDGEVLRAAGSALSSSTVLTDASGPRCMAAVGLPTVSCRKVSQDPDAALGEGHGTPSSWPLWERLLPGTLMLAPRASS